MTSVPTDAVNDASRSPADAARLGSGSIVPSGVGVNVAPGSDDDGWVAPPPARLADGTAVQLYKDGEALHAAYRAIERARQSVGLEVYIFHADETGRAFADVLARRARDGVAVRVVYDSIGSAGADRAMFDTMRRAGVRLREFHPWPPWRAQHGWRPFNRDHRKLVVVDDDVAVLGGQNLGNEYGSSWVVGHAPGDCWRDTAVGVCGPSASLFSATFDRMWDYTQCGGPIRRAEFIQTRGSLIRNPGGSLVDPDVGRERRDAAESALEIPPGSCAVLASVPVPRSRLLPSLRKLLRDARSSIEMTMAYFAPPDMFVEQLCRSARDGVTVRLMLPGRSDVGLLRIAARAFYERLLSAGVEVYERQHAVLHAKTLCIDGHISIVGSTNLDYRSVQYNCELSAVIHSELFGRQMHDLFEHDVCFARRILPDEWRSRPRRDRLAQWAVMRARYLL
jgi:cardiolipin synthase